MKFLRCLSFTFLIQTTAFPTWLSDIPLVLTQPNGQIIDCFVTGDQYSRRIHDSQGFTILMNEYDGYYYYADQDGSGGLVTTDILVGSSDPSNYGLEPGYAVSFEIYQRQKEFYDLNLDTNLDVRDAPSNGTVNQINVFIRFADDPPFPNTRAFYDEPFNAVDQSSLRDYFYEVSYGTLTVDTYHYPPTMFGENNSFFTFGELLLLLVKN